MATPPQADPEELRRTLVRIANRRRKIDDEQFGSVDWENPSEVRRYLRKRYAWTMRVAPWVGEADAFDGLVLLAWQWWEERAEEHWWLTTAHKLGWSYAQIGSPLGIGRRVRGPKNERGERTGNRRQGAKSRIDRLAALLTYRQPDESLIREARHADRQDAHRADPQAKWLAEHAEVVADVAARLCELHELADEEAASDLVEVGRHLRENDWTPGALVWMGLASQGLRATQRVIELPDRHPVWHVLQAVDDLRSAFAELTEPRLAWV